ncbi:MAG: hypothetical protein ACQEP1_02195 [Nanobdellota archaeon]
MDKHPVIGKAEELAKAIKKTDIEDPLEFSSLIVECNQIIESRVGIDYGKICAGQSKSGGCCK